MHEGPMQAKSRQSKGLGGEGEDLAVEYLCLHGFKIVARNVRYKVGEIDVIAKRGEELHFIEVKSRSNGSLISPLEAVTPAKIKKLKRAAQMYLLDRRNRFKESKLPPCIFSVIGINYVGGEPQIECVLDAFA